ncbi:MAG: hypothetical protein ACYTBP_12170 [Planctomycetota bacterium]
MLFTRFEEGSGYCGRCLKQVPVGRRRINHFPHILLTVCTAGIWAIVWIRRARRQSNWVCLDCGEEVYRIMS